MPDSFDIPVLLVAFNRPDTTLQVIQAIRKVRPQRLYVAVDAARPHKPGEVQLCEKTKRVILDTIDWDCEVKTLFREQNAGCARGVSGAISWMLQTEEMGIILEDDCVPGDSFFRYCKTLLHHYRDDERIMHISGFSVQPDTQRGGASYYFSKYAELWGWATWRRAWQKFDFDLTHFSGFVDQGGLDAIFQRPAGIKQRWMKNFTRMIAEDPPTVWGYRWMYSIWKENGLCITPQVSLVKNIGFDERAVHTKVANSQLDQIVSHELAEITHPPLMIPNVKADELTSELRHQPPLLKRAKLKMQQLAHTVRM